MGINRSFYLISYVGLRIVRSICVGLARMQGIGLGIGLAKEEEAPFVSKVNFSSELLPSKGEGPIQNPNGRLQPSSLFLFSFDEPLTNHVYV